MNTEFFFSLALVVFAAILSLLFSSLTFALRDFSRTKLTDRLESIGMSHWTERTLERAGDLIFVTAIGRLFANLFVFIGVVHMLRVAGLNNEWALYGLAVVFTTLITLFVSVAIPHALAEHVGETLIAYSVRFLHGLRFALLPMARIMHVVDRLIRNLAGRADVDQPEQREQREEQIEQEILSVVEAGAKEGIVDVQEREMIESAIEFGDTTCGQAMTSRPDIIGLPINAKLEQVKSIFEESGHSRLPVYEGTLDKIIGVLYARDLIRLAGLPADGFEVRTAMRPAVYVPKTKPLRDLLHDFRAQKVHIAIVLDEYGGTAGLVTIEDVLKELVGEISDEHEPSEPSLVKRLDDHTSEADARILIEQLNRVLSLNLPEDAGYETLGGFVSTTMGRIPEVGAMFEHNGTRFTILQAEPQRIDRVKIEVVNTKPVAANSDVSA